MALSTLIFGDSGRFKTTQAKFFARYEYAVTGKMVRIVTAEEWLQLRPLVEVGVAEVFHLNSIPLGQRFIYGRKLGQGWWPQLGPKGLRLVAPTPETWDRVGSYIFEGLTSNSDLLMDEMRRMGYTGGETPAGAAFKQVLPGDTAVEEHFSNQTRGQYLQVQKEMYTLVNLYKALPVHRVLFTAHEAQGEDEDTRKQIRGPGLAGSAATAHVPRWVGDCIHLEYYPETRVTQDKLVSVIEPHVRAFFVEHPDPRFPDITYKCKSHVTSEKLAQLMAKFKDGYFVPTLTEGLDTYLAEVDRLMGESQDEWAQWKKAVDAARAPKEEEAK